MKKKITVGHVLIIAILVVDNVNLLLSTIISRCQLIKLNKKNFEESSLVNFNKRFARLSPFSDFFCNLDSLV